jgi:predicted dehydrogenase
MLKLRGGIIGLGRIGAGFDDTVTKSVNTHAGAHHKSKNVELISLCDIDSKKLKKYSKKYNVSSVYRDFQKMLKEESLDIVSICTHADSHLNLVKQAIKYNIKGIYLEKPISNSLNDASKIINLCKINNVSLQINHQRRFDKFYDNIKNLIEKNSFGSIQNVVIYYGGGVANTGSHIFDLIEFLFGKISWVEGKKSLNISNNLSDPNLNGIIHTKSGVVCYLHSIDLKNYGIAEFDILFEKGRIKIDLTKSTCKLFTVAPRQPNLSYPLLIPMKKNIPQSKNLILLGLDNLCNSIRNTEPLLCSGENGYSSLEIIVSLLISTKSKNRINLPINTKMYKINSK